MRFERNVNVREVYKNMNKSEQNIQMRLNKFLLLFRINN